MIEKKTLDELLDKLLSQTRASNLEWFSLPQYFESNHNEPLRRYIIDNNKYAYSEDGTIRDKASLISEYRSKCLPICGGTIVVFVYKQGGAIMGSGLAVQTSNAAPVTLVDCTDEQTEKINAILSVVNDAGYGVMKYMKSVIEEL